MNKNYLELNKENASNININTPRWNYLFVTKHFKQIPINPT